MPQYTATHFKEVTNGFEKRSDGLWVHRGKLSVGPHGDTMWGTSGDVGANRGDGTGVYYFAGNPLKYLYYDGTKFQLQGGQLSASLVAGTAQALIGIYSAAVSWSTAVTGQWLPTPITYTATSTGGLLRIEFQAPLYHTAANGSFYTGIGWDAALQAAVSIHAIAAANTSNWLSWVYYTTPAAGARTFTIYVYNNTAGTLTFHSAVASVLSITEQRA